MPREEQPTYGRPYVERARVFDSSRHFIVVDASGGESTMMRSGLSERTADIVCAAFDADASGIGGLEAQMRAANRRVFEQARDAPEGGARAFASAIAGSIVGGGLALAHVGTCRAYRIRAGRLTQLTRNHDGRWAGIFGGGEPDGLVCNYLGMDPDRGELQVVDHRVELERGDRVLVCTHRLEPRLTHRVLETMLTAHVEPQVAIDALRDAALAGEDEYAWAAMVLIDA